MKIYAVVEIERYEPDFYVGFYTTGAAAEKVRKAQEERNIAEELSFISVIIREIEVQE